MTSKACNICKRMLDNPADPCSKDCGGDCLLCMIEIGEDPDCIEVMAQELAKRGYYGFSNKYRIVCRIDREDWLKHMAGVYHKAVADFYVMSGDHLTNSTGRWGAHYASVFSHDKLEGIPQSVYARLKKIANEWDMRYVPLTMPNQEVCDDRR